MRRRLAAPLPPDTINDDFVLPMEIVARGYRALYRPDAMATELECADAATDRRRRRRIGAGNLQQAIRLRRLLHPRYGWTAFVFASGKVLRPGMPFAMLAALCGSAVLAPPPRRSRACWRSRSPPMRPRCCASPCRKRGRCAGSIPSPISSPATPPH